MLVLIDTSKEVSLVTLRCTDGYTLATTKLVIGKVVCTCQDKVQVGEDVVLAGTAIDYIRQHGLDRVYVVRVIKNERARSDSDPYWFAINVMVYGDPVARAGF